jgi:hypothetical protein
MELDEPIHPRIVDFGRPRHAKVRPSPRPPAPGDRAQGLRDPAPLTAPADYIVVVDDLIDDFTLPGDGDGEDTEGARWAAHLIRAPIADHERAALARNEASRTSASVPGSS